MPQPYAQHLEKLMQKGADPDERKKSAINAMIAQFADKPDGDVGWITREHYTLIAVKHPYGILILQVLPGHLPEQPPIIQPIPYSKENAAWPIP